MAFISSHIGHECAYATNIRNLEGSVNNQTVWLLSSAPHTRSNHDPSLAQDEVVFDLPQLPIGSIVRTSSDHLTFFDFA